MSTSDSAEWDLALAGRGEAFGSVYDRHHDRVLRHSRRLVVNSADEEDVVSLAFLEVWRKRDSVRFVNGSLLPWLLVVANYSAKNLSRSARRHESLLRRLPPIQDAPAAADELSDIELALSRLPIAARQVITLCVLEGFKLSEAAIVLNVLHGTVKSRLSRAKHRLAQEFLIGPVPATAERTS